MPTEEIFAAALRVQDSLPQSSVPPSTEVSALVVTRGSSKPSRKGAMSGKSRNSFPPCKYYGKMSHPAEKCWKEFGKPGWVLTAVGGKSGSVTYRFRASLNHKDDGQTKFIKPNSQR